MHICEQIFNIVTISFPGVRKRERTNIRQSLANTCQGIPQEHLAHRALRIHVRIHRRLQFHDDLFTCLRVRRTTYIYKIRNVHIDDATLCRANRLLEVVEEDLECAIFKIAAFAILLEENPILTRIERFRHILLDTVL